MSTWLLMYNAPGGRVANVRPERGGTVNASLSFREPEPRYERLSRAEQQQVLAERMSGAAWRVDDLLAAMPDAGDPLRAFAAYQQRMAAYVAGGMELPPGGIRAFAPRSRAMIRLRALSLRMITHWPSKQLLARQFAKAEAITLPDHPAPSRPR